MIHRYSNPKNVSVAKCNSYRNEISEGEFFPKVKFWFVILTLFEFSRQKQDSKLLETAHFKVSQVQIDGFSTISDEQNFTFKQIRQTEISILV